MASENKTTAVDLDLGDLGDSAKPKRSGKTVKVPVATTFAHLNTVSRHIHSDYVSMVEHRGGKMSIDEIEFMAYVRTIFSYRIEMVNGNKSNYNKLKFNCVLPHTVLSIISTIGKAYLDEYGYNLVPKELKLTHDISGPDGVFDNVLDVIRISNSLFTMKRDLSISMSEQLPASDQGDAKVMSFNYIIDGDLKGPDTSRHPNQAFAALVASVSLPEQYLVPMVTYINKDSVDMLLALVPRFENLRK